MSYDTNVSAIRSAEDRLLRLTTVGDILTKRQMRLIIRAELIKLLTEVGVKVVSSTTT